MHGFIAQCSEHLPSSASPRQATLMPHLPFTLRNLKFNDVHTERLLKPQLPSESFMLGRGQGRSLITGIAREPVKGDSLSKISQAS